MTPQRQQPADAIERIFHAWDESLVRVSCRTAGV
jgi:hypothetical protein